MRPIGSSGLRSPISCTGVVAVYILPLSPAAAPFVGDRTSAPGWANKYGYENLTGSYIYYCIRYVH